MLSPPADDLVGRMKSTDTHFSQGKGEADISDPGKRLNTLQKQQLSQRPHNAERGPSTRIYYSFAFMVGSSVMLPTYSNSLAQTIIGLSVLFFGVTLFRIRTTKHGGLGLADATAVSSMKALDRLLLALDYRGKPIYLPPPNSPSQAWARVFIPANPGNQIPPETETAGTNLVTQNPEGLCLTPPGEGLADLFEKELGVSFSTVDLDYLRSHLPRLLAKDLELVKGLMLTRLGDTIHVKIEGSAYAPLCTRLERETGICQTLGCPLTSAIAIMLARTTHEPITIDTVETSNDGKTIEAWYGILKA